MSRRRARPLESFWVWRDAAGFVEAVCWSEGAAFAQWHLSVEGADALAAFFVWATACVPGVSPPVGWLRLERKGFDVVLRSLGAPGKAREVMSALKAQVLH